MKLSDFVGLGLIGWAFANILDSKRAVKQFRFRCWLCRTETLFNDPGTAGKYSANCGYCGLPCLFETDRVTPLVQATVGEIKREEFVCGS